MKSACGAGVVQLNSSRDVRTFDLLARSQSVRVYDQTVRSLFGTAKTILETPKLAL